MVSGGLTFLSQGSTSEEFNPLCMPFSWIQTQNKTDFVLLFHTFSLPGMNLAEDEDILGMAEEMELEEQRFDVKYMNQMKKEVANYEPHRVKMAQPKSVAGKTKKPDKKKSKTKKSGKESGGKGKGGKTGQKKREEL